MSKNTTYNIAIIDDEYSEENERFATLEKIAIKENCTIKYFKSFASFIQETPDLNSTYHAIIFDIEIWEEKEGVEKLTGLGFHYIDQLQEKGRKKPVYTILTKTPVSICKIITSKMTGISGHEQKNDVLINEEKQKEYIIGLRRAIDAKRDKKNETTKIEEFYQKYKDYINNNEVVTIDLKIIDLIVCRSKEEIEEVIKKQSVKLIEKWLKIIIEHNKKIQREYHRPAYKCNLLSEENECFTEEKNLFIREEKKNRAIGHKKFGTVNQVNEYSQGEFEKKDFHSFVRALILRRVMIYVTYSENIKTYFSDAYSLESIHGWCCSVCRKGYVDINLLFDSQETFLEEETKLLERLHKGEELIVFQE